MKQIKHMFAALAACLSVRAFQPKPVTLRRTSPLQNALVEDFVNKWAELEERQRDLERNPDDVRLVAIFFAALSILPYCSMLFALTYQSVSVSCILLVTCLPVERI